MKRGEDGDDFLLGAAVLMVVLLGWKNNKRFVALVVFVGVLGLLVRFWL